MYNEARTVRQVIERLLQIPLPAAREIIVVNDGSTDGTREVLDGIAPVDGVLSIVHAAANGGKGSALRIGLSHARGTIVAIQDADLELDPVQLGGLVQPILDGEADVVYGSRFLAGRPPGPWISVAANRGLTWLTNVLFGGRLTDMETCYKIMAASGRAQSPARVESLRYRAGDHGEAAAPAAPHRRAPGDLRSEKPRERQEDRLARRVSRDRRAAEIQIPVID